DVAIEFNVRATPNFVLVKRYKEKLANSGHITNEELQWIKWNVQDQVEYPNHTSHIFPTSLM
ncbi:unnamed protein product, partial [Thlaspi arvense]